MAVNYTVQAEVIDLRTDSPSLSDSFLVDTQPWIWITYASFSQAENPPSGNQLKHYSSYLNKAISAKAKLLHCGLSLAEMAHQIEKTESYIYNAYANTSGQDIKPKEYRHNFPSERTRISSEVQSVWNQVKSMSSSLEVLIDDSTTNISLQSLKKWCLDGYDAFFVEAMTKNSIHQIITDDGDFTTVSGIQVFTANTNVINTARSQRKLIKR